MPLLKELGTAVRQRRQEMGLSQQQLASLVDLSRATVNSLETGKLNDLSSNRIERLANELGFAVGLVGTRRSKDKSAIDAAARIASVPYTKELPAAVLLESLKEGVVPPGYIPHLRTLLQEAPVAILANVADELRQSHDVPVPDTWKRMRMLAGVLKCDRRLWQSMPI
ncbi:helix-turn-helix transcriptional regulator [Ramlibacter sp. G-1-2-2]|uniref:Helix-turn-helix transcriptional regulator n=1 Tax=Ramlibacter agri TaxID=2728837 RepID=A0A848GUK3_9BURK|nr:helix-turn-helix transcriptional regulator [Ramlibacter agri]NML42306.1 helix-turn-helix transcriptional regulator [Ramlibacter agri]